MKDTINQLKQLAEECIEFAISIKQAQNHTNLCNNIDIYMSSGGNEVTFNSNNYQNRVAITLYSNTITMSLNSSEEFLEKVLLESKKTFLEFKASDLSEKIKTNNENNSKRINELKAELELLTNNNIINENKTISSE